MRPVRLLIAGLMGFLVVAPVAAPGSGYSIDERGAEAMADAGGFAARAIEPSALPGVSVGWRFGGR